MHTVLTNYSRLQIYEDGTWNVFASSSLAKEGVKRIISTADGLVRRHLPIWLNTVFKTVEFPAGISNLDSGLSGMNRDTLTLYKVMLTLLHNQSLAQIKCLPF